MANLAGPPGQSLHQAELDGLIRGADAADQAGKLMDARAGTPAGGTLGAARAQAVAGRAELAVRWEMLQQRNVEWDCDFWAECRALYAGGKRLLGNKVVFERLFPKNLAESDRVYGQRKGRAHYYPYAGTIIDSLLAGLSQDPLRIAFGTMNDEGELEPAEDAEWWQQFVEDVSDEASTPDHPEPDEDDDEETTGLSMHHFLVELMRECLQTGFTWVQCDLPPAPVDPTAIDSELAAEKAGVRSPFLCLVRAECVIDWEYQGKELAWLLTLEKTSPRPSIAVKRGKLEHHKYTLWTQTDCVVYELDVDPTNPPPLDRIVAPTGGGAHDFGCVPFDRVCLPEGLYAMGKLHNLAREHFNKRNAMSWAEYKALFSVLYEFLDDSNEGGDIPTVGAEPDRATSQTRGQGFTQIRRKGDEARYIGPDVAPFKEARESCNDAMREMHRVMFSMALSANMDKQALSRSGDSKAQDQVSTQVILLAMGQLLRRIARVLLALAARGRGEKAPPPALIGGVEHFDVTGITQTIADAVQVFSGGVPLSKSATAYKLYAMKIFRAIVGDDATDKQLADIRKELEESITAEQLMAEALVPGGAGGTDPEDPNDEGDDKGGDKGDDGDREPPERDAGGAGGRFKSKPMKRRG